LSLCLDIVDFVVVLFLYLVKLLFFLLLLLATMLMVNKDEYIISETKLLSSDDWPMSCLNLVQFSDKHPGV